MRPAGKFEGLPARVPEAGVPRLEWCPPTWGTIGDLDLAAVFGRDPVGNPGCQLRILSVAFGPAV